MGHYQQAKEEKIMIELDNCRIHHTPRHCSIGRFAEWLRSILRGIRVL